MNEESLKTPQSQIDVSIPVQNPDVSAEISPSTPDVNNNKEVESPKPVKKESVAKVKLKENKIFFYGLPLAVILFSLSALFIFVIPTISYYFDYKSKMGNLNTNKASVTASISNLQSAISQEETLDTYSSKLEESLPKDPKLGNLINLIQTKANDFNLENNVFASDNSGRTSVSNLSDQDSKSFLQRINSGELVFQSKSTTADVDAILISIEVNVRGDREKFFEFLKQLKDVKPIINVVYIDYKETPDSVNANQREVNVLMKLESYAMKVSDTNVDLSFTKQYKKDDPKLESPMQIEKFEWDVKELQKLIAN
jgi:hypothetical protein